MVNLKGLMMILELHRQGLAVSAIADRTGYDRKTVRKYIRQGLVAPKYKPRAPAARAAAHGDPVIRPFEDYLRERIAAWPELTGARLLREIRELGYGGGNTALKDFLRKIRPSAPVALRYETPAGQQAQVDFAEFRVEFDDEPDVEHKVRLFAMALGHSGCLWGHLCLSVLTDYELAVKVTWPDAYFRQLTSQKREATIFWYSMRTSSKTSNILSLARATSSVPPFEARAEAAIVH